MASGAKSRCVAEPLRIEKPVVPVFVERNFALELRAPLRLGSTVILDEPRERFDALRMVRHLERDERIGFFRRGERALFGESSSDRFEVFDGEIGIDALDIFAQLS